jgi:hypothetical protein
MSSAAKNPVVEIIGEDNFNWMSTRFTQKTLPADVPDEILEAVSGVDVTVRDYRRDPRSITAIALVTFAYSLAGRTPEARHGSNDLMLVKALAQKELARRRGCSKENNRMLNRPLFELITGEVGERIRATRFMTNPVG